jgi:hypothetical protein
MSIEYLLMCICDERRLFLMREKTVLGEGLFDLRRMRDQLFELGYLLQLLHLRFLGQLHQRLFLSVKLGFMVLN